MFEDKIKAINGEAKIKTTYSVEEVMKMLQVCRPTVYKLIEDRCFRAIKVGKTYRIVKRDFDYWLDGGVE